MGGKNFSDNYEASSLQIQRCLDIKLITNSVNLIGMVNVLIRNKIIWLKNLY
jgi:hypothetical protein